MAKKNNMLIYLAIAALFIIIIGGKQGWFSSSTQSVVYTTQLQQALENPSPTYHANLYFTMNTVCMNVDQTTGKIESNMPGATCSLYMNEGTGFKPLEQVTLDGNGFWSLTDSFGDPAGIKIFKAICEKSGAYATTNEATVTVNDCTEKQFIQPEETTPDTPKCVDSDNDAEITVAGSCSEAQPDGTWTGYDICESANTVKEWSCDSFDECRSVVITCAPGYYCFNGACMIGQPACAASCQAQTTYNWNTGGCFAPDINVDSSVADTCVRNYGDWTSAYGCDFGLVCCCR